jgi:glycosyltransferase involved in cell wall biosynthesis
LNDKHRICAVIPIYNHGSTTEAVVDSLEKHGLSTILVDDGSEQDTADILDLVVQGGVSRQLVRLTENSGKGGAVMAGFAKAQELGYTHALQVDADGQHDLDCIRVLLESSIRWPEALIAGAPIYDESAPRSRLVGRRITNFWVTIETLSRDIPDAMCGFRIYPIGVTLATLASALYVDKRMGFDIEIIVRLHWRQIAMVFHPVGVAYTEDGVSNFHMIRDNIGITLVHTKLFFGMILRVPALIVHRLVGD